MADDQQTKGPNGSTRSVVADFIGTVWGKVLTVLAAITMLLGIAAEGVSLYRNWWDAKGTAINYHAISDCTPSLLYLKQVREARQEGRTPPEPPLCNP